jgi:multiple antibiotic resistance protein
MLASDLSQFIGELLLVFAGLLPIVNPVGSAPMFLALTRGADAPTRAMLSRVVAINSTLMLIGAFAIGAYVLKIFGLSVPVVQVAGGAVLCRLGWTLLNASPDAEPTAATPTPEKTFAARAFYPLTMPLTVDPGVLSVAIAMGANHSGSLTRALILESSALIAIVLIGIAIYIAYRYAGAAASWLGQSRVQVLLRLSAFIVLCIGVQIAWNGLKTLHAELDEPVASAAPAPGLGDMPGLPSSPPTANPAPPNDVAPTAHAATPKN